VIERCLFVQGQLAGERIIRPSTVSRDALSTSVGGSAEPTVAPIATLIVGDSLKQINAFKIRPQLASHINFGIRDLPE